MLTNRRQFLATAAGSVALVGSAPSVPSLLLRAAATESSADNVLVVVQLSGGNDGVNTVIPYGDDAYYKNRFTLAIQPDSVLKIDDAVGFHPSMGGIHTLLQQGQLAVVNGVGYANPNRSHFESMDLWHSAHREEGLRRVGWLARCADRCQTDAAAIHFGSETQPLALSNGRTQAASLRSLKDFRIGQLLAGSLGSVAEANVANSREVESSLLSFVQDSSKSALATAERLEHVIGMKKLAVRFPSSELGKKLESVAQLIAADMPTRIYYVTLDGFDTHANQADAHAGLMTQVSEALAAFQQQMTGMGHADRVMVLAFSEFGRRLKENASLGTDHGAAAPVLIAGGNVNAGVIGRYPSLTDLDDGDLRYHTDYRSVYATLLDRWLGFDSSEILGQKFPHVDFVKS